jgi:hypothetical protein
VKIDLLAPSSHGPTRSAHPTHTSSAPESSFEAFLGPSPTSVGQNDPFGAKSPSPASTKGAGFASSEAAGPLDEFSASSLGSSTTHTASFDPFAAVPEAPAPVPLPTDCDPGTFDAFSAAFEDAFAADLHGSPMKNTSLARPSPAPEEPGSTGGLRVQAPAHARGDVRAVSLGAVPARTPWASSNEGMRDLSLVVAELRARVESAVGAAVARREAGGLAPRAERGSDSLWSERSTVGRGARGRSGGEPAVVDEKSEQIEQKAQEQREQREQNEKHEQQAKATWNDATALWSLSSTATVKAPEAPAGPVRVAVDHLSALLPEGGRVLEARSDHVRLELPHQLGAMQIEITMRAGVVDVRARGGAAGEMAWRVPELAAALQSAGVRLGAFEVRPVEKTRSSSATDDGQAGQRQNSDGRSTSPQHAFTRRAVSAIGASARGR